MEYATPLTLVSSSYVSKIQGIQYRALRIIFNAPLKASSTELAQLDTMHTRLTNLSKKYLDKVIYNDNEIICVLISNRSSLIESTDSNMKTLLNIMGFDEKLAKQASQTRANAITWEVGSSNPQGVT